MSKSSKIRPFSVKPMFNHCKFIMLDLGQKVLKKNMPTKNLIGQGYNLLGT